MTTSQHEETTSVGEPEQTATFTSKLDGGAQRFLAHVLVHAHEIGRRTGAQFIRHFPPSVIMEGLESRPHLRADILEVATGVKRKIALKKSAASAGEDVQIALDEQVCTPDDVVEAFKPDDRVRYLDNKKLWAYAIEGEFWKTDPKNKKEHERAKKHVAFMLDRALADKLISHQDLIEGVSVEMMAKSLPRDILAEVISSALALGKNKKVFTEAHLLEVAAARVLVEELSLEHIWQTVVVPEIAEAHGLADAPLPSDAKEEASSASEKSEKKEAPKEDSKPAPDAKEAPRAAKASSNSQKSSADKQQAKTAAAKPAENGKAKKTAPEAEENVDIVEIMEMEEEEFEERTDPGLRGG